MSHLATQRLLLMIALLLLCDGTPFISESPASLIAVLISVLILCFKGGPEVADKHRRTSVGVATYGLACAAVGATGLQKEGAALILLMSTLLTSKQLQKVATAGLVLIVLYNTCPGWSQVQTINISIAGQPLALESLMPESVILVGIVLGMETPWYLLAAPLLLGIPLLGAWATVTISPASKLGNCLPMVEDVCRAGLAFGAVAVLSVKNASSWPGRQVTNGMLAAERRLFWNGYLSRFSEALVRCRMTILTGVAVVLLATYVMTRVALPLECPNSAAIGVLDEGGMDWEVPRTGHYGSFSLGMFGLLPKYAEAAGIRIEKICVAPGQEIAEAALQPYKCVMLFNNCRLWDNAEIEAVTKYIRSGGTLIAFVDHTDVFGLASTGGRLFENFGLRINFDSAFPLRRSWRGCVDPVNAARMIWKHSIIERGLGWGIGASLTTSREWEPILVGRYAFSDHGIRSNVVGSLLGDYELDVGECWSGQVLACERDLGRGRMMVFGDTSFMQNGSVMSNFEERVLPLLRYGTSSAVNISIIIYWLYTVMLVSAGALALYMAMNSNDVVLLLALSALLLIPMGLRPNFSIASRMGCGRRTIAILNDFGSDIGHQESHYNSDFSLYVSAARQNYETVPMRTGDPRLMDCGAAVIYAPWVTISQAEIATLTKYVGRGGCLILFASGIHAAVMSPLLRDFGLTGGRLITGKNLKREYDDNAARICSFLEPGRIELLSPQVPAAEGGSMENDILYEVGNCPIICRVKYKAGSLVWVCDSKFLSENNMESMQSYDAYNLSYLEQLIRGAIDGQLPHSK